MIMINAVEFRLNELHGTENIAILKSRYFVLQLKNFLCCICMQSKYQNNIYPIFSSLAYNSTTGLKYCFDIDVFTYCPNIDVFIYCANIDKNYFNVSPPIFLNNDVSFKIFKKLLNTGISQEIFPMNVTLGQY